ncbi:MAG: cytochrome b/b6 domain-containing protein [Pseudomonadota bacterium]
MTTRLLKRQYIYDGAQRILHWWLAFSVIALAATGLIASNMEAGGGRAYTWDLHILAGMALITGFAGRLVWGLIGPEHARFKSLIHIKTWIESAKTRQMTTADSEFGHHKQASASYVGFYGLVALMCMTGVTLAGILHGEGPLAESLLDELENVRIIGKVHEYGGWAIAFFAVTHVMAMIFHEWRDQIPISQSMISGFQYRTSKKGEKDESK